MRLLLVLFSIFIIFLSLFTYVYIDPNLIYLSNFYTGYFQTNREIVSVLYLISIVVFFIFYIYFLKKIEKKIFIFLFIIPVTFLLFSYPAILSYDVFNYIFTAKVLFHYHENPFLIMPIEFLGDPLLLFTHAANKVALYGPAWISLTGFPFLLGFDNFLLTLFNFKAFALIFYLGASYLVYKEVDLKNSAFFILNPLVLIETLVSSHNDIVMMFFALFSIVLFRKNKIFLSVILILISILIKYATIFLIPVFIYLFYMKVRNKKIEYEKVYLYSGISMLIIFFMSIFRGEIYPWYSIWFLIFAALSKNYFFKFFSMIMSFFLLLTYISFMYSGSYFGSTPLINNLLILIPVGIFTIYISYLRLKKIK